MLVNVCRYVCVCTYVFRYVYMYVYMYVPTCTCKCIRMYLCIYMSTWYRYIYGTYGMHECMHALFAYVCIRRIARGGTWMNVLPVTNLRKIMHACFYI